MNTKYKKKLYQKQYRYSISEEEYLYLMGEATCAICGLEFIDNQEKCIDHNHSTGEVRGVLCHSCNKGLGFFKDSIFNLELAIEYLKQ